MSLYLKNKEQNDDQRNLLPSNFRRDGQFQFFSVKLFVALNAPGPGRSLKFSNVEHRL